MNLIVFAEWHQRGYADAIAKTWFQSKCHIVGLKYLVNNFTAVSSYVKEHGPTRANIVWLDSI